MRTSADEVSIHAVSPESTFRASSACASEASASAAASASDERTHQYPAAKDRCLLSIVPPVRCEETVEQWWCHDLRQGVIREPRSEEHTSELQSRFNLVCRLLL